MSTMFHAGISELREKAKELADSNTEAAAMLCIASADLIGETAEDGLFQVRQVLEARGIKLERVSRKREANGSAEAPKRRTKHVEVMNIDD